jgi:hypothetical protein
MYNRLEKRILKLEEKVAKLCKPSPPPSPSSSPRPMIIPGKSNVRFTPPNLVERIEFISYDDLSQYMS